MVNLKLDKTGGLTEALRARNEAARLNLRLMVGCMVGSSLGMAPAVLLAQGAAYCDLDGPVASGPTSRPHPLQYDAQGVHPSQLQPLGISMTAPAQRIVYLNGDYLPDPRPGSRS